MEIKELIERWNSGIDKPFKGALIDYEDYQEKGDVSCMCAQGQALHLLGGMEPGKLANLGQSKADSETAKLLDIPISQAVLLRNVNDSIDGAPSIVLTNPEKIIGEHAALIIAFWRHIDSLTLEQWAAARAAVRDAAGDAAWEAAGNAAGNAARAAAGNAAGIAARDAAWAAARASNEIQGHKLMEERKQNLYFLPMFGIDSIEQLKGMVDASE